METHRYVRQKLRGDTSDAYNSISPKYPSPHPKTEFWTNGKITHLTSPPCDFFEHYCAQQMSESAAEQITIRPKIPQNKSPQDNVVRNSLFAGSIAGIVSTFAMHPLDVIRTKMQSGIRTRPGASIGASGPAEVFAHTVQHGGVTALYTGVTLPIAAQAVYKATVFTVNNVCQRMLVEWRTQERYKIGMFEPYKLQKTDVFLCGMLGGGVNAALFVTPVEYVRNQLIAQHSKIAMGQKLRWTASGPLDVVRQTVYSSGISGLWRGLSLAVARDSLGCGCFFLGMVWTQEFLTTSNNQQQDEDASPSIAVTLASGAMAGMAYWLTALPFDTVKTWVQAGDAPSASAAITNSLRERGPTGTFMELFRGWQVAYGRGAPSAAITLVVYSLSYKFMAQGF